MPNIVENHGLSTDYIHTIEKKAFWESLCV